MSSRVHPNLRYLWKRALVDALPSAIITGLCGYGIYYTRGTEYALICIAGVIFMVVIAVGRIAWHRWWISRASRLIESSQPVPMLLTAGKGWSKVALQPALGMAGLPTISGIRFIMTFSGVARTTQVEQPVEAYFDQYLPDLIVIRYDGQLLCSDMQNRMEGRESGIVRKTELLPPVE